MSELWSALVAFCFDLLPFTKDVAKQWFESHGLGPLWANLRDYVFDYNTWILGLFPCLALEALMPAVAENASRRASRWLDIIYPVMGAIFLAPFALIFVSGIQEFYQAYIPWINTGLLDGRPMWLQLLGAFIISDFMLYVAHYIKHRVPWLWFFHAIHHSQENLNPMSTVRTHGLEGIIDFAIRTIPIGFIGGSAPSWAIYLVLNNFWGFFAHANVRTNLGPLKYLLVSPQFHRVHHSILPEHVDKNFGERIILWDWMFGTMVKDFDVYPPTGVLGIERWVIETKASPLGLIVSWFKQAAYPFFKIGQSVRNSF